MAAQANPADDYETEASPEGEHLDPEVVFDFIEDRLSRRRSKEVEAHLARCADCVEALAMVLRSERPATREEQEILARVPEVDAETVVERLRPAIQDSAPGKTAAGIEWRPIVISAVIAALLLSMGLFLRSQLLPVSSRRVANETLAALVELRQATGRIPLRYISEFERAGIVLSTFDDTAAIEEQLIDSLRESVEEAPDLDAQLILGLILLDEGELDEAEALLEQVREERPDSVDAVNGLAVLHYARAQRSPEDEYALLQEGLGILREAAAIDPEDPRVLYNFGKFYDALEMRSAAIAAWQRYLERDPDSQWAEEAAYRIAQELPR